jgi:hypothetical protein
MWNSDHSLSFLNSKKITFAKTTYYICLSSIIFPTGMASDTYMLQVHNFIHYICAFLIYSTNVLFYAAQYLAMHHVL